MPYHCNVLTDERCEGVSAQKCGLAVEGIIWQSIFVRGLLWMICSSVSLEKTDLFFFPLPLRRCLSPVGLCPSIKSFLKPSSEDRDNMWDGLRGWVMEELGDSIGHAFEKKLRMAPYHTWLSLCFFPVAVRSPCTELREFIVGKCAFRTSEILASLRLDIGTCFVGSSSSVSVLDSANAIL